MRRSGNGKQPEEQHLHKQQHQEAERHHVEMAVVGRDDVEIEDGGVVKKAVYPRPTRVERDFSSIGEFQTISLRKGWRWV